jgi:plasmid stabilization system protein ParE
VRYKILFTPEAVDTFDAISTQILDRWGESKLQEFKLRVSKYLEIIAQSPYIYPILSELFPDLRRCILHKNCSIIYKVMDQDIHVICFWDNRQEPLFE